MKPPAGAARIRVLLAGLFVLGSGSVAHAYTVHCVNPGGTGGCFASIQAAVDAAASGDYVQIAAGTYFESVTLPAGKRLGIGGAGASQTIIDGGGAPAVLRYLGPNPKANSTVATRCATAVRESSSRAT